MNCLQESWDGEVMLQCRAYYVAVLKVGLHGKHTNSEVTLSWKERNKKVIDQTKNFMYTSPFTNTNG